MIYFKKLRWKNLLSTGNVFTEIDLCSKDVTLIVGINGAGKSTILDALSFVLFGKPFRKINKPQLLNTITNKNLVVEIEFSIGSTNYKIVRGMKPNIFEVYQNDKLLNQSAEMKDYQEVLEKQIIKVNHKSFCQVVILGSATFQPFMQLPSAYRREVIEDLLDLNIFTTMNSLLKDKVQNNNEELIQCQANKKLLEEKIRITKQHLHQIETDNSQLIEQKKAKILEIETQTEVLNKEYQQIKQVISDLSEKIVDESSIKNKINKLNNLRHQIEANLSHINKEIDFFHKHDTCPTCKQMIEVDFKTNTVKEKQSKVSEIETGLIQLSEQYDKTNERLTEIINITNKINQNKMDMHVISTKINSLKEYKEELEKDIKGIVNKSVNDNEDQIKKFESELINNEIEYNTLNEDKNILLAAGVLLKDTGIKSKIIKQYIPVINKLINKYLSSMDFFVSFELDENFNETIKSRYRDNFSYASFSEGEKQKIDLALLFTWRVIAKLRNSINTNLLIMDEVFDSSLDGNATDYLMNIIRETAKDNNIFIISHKEHMNEKFNNVIKVIKHKNFSQIQ